MIAAATRGARPGTPRRSSSAAPPTSIGPTVSAGRHIRSGAYQGSRAASTTPSEPPARRATYSMHSREAASAHCASSSTTSTGRWHAAVRSTPSAATQTAKRSPGTGGPSASAPASAAACGAGRESSSLCSGCSRSASTANASCAPVSVPHTRSTVISSGARSTSASSSVVLPIPASPWTTSAEPWPRRSATSSSSSRASSPERPTTIAVNIPWATHPQAVVRPAVADEDRRCERPMEGRRP